MGKDSPSDSDSSNKDSSDSGSDSDSSSGSDDSRSGSNNSASSNSQSGSESENDSDHKRSSSSRNTSRNGGEEEDMDVNVDSSDSQGEHDGTSRLDNIKAIVREAAEKPDLYGIRRSGRQRKEVARYTAGNDSDSDDDERRRNSSGRSGRGSRKTSDDWKNSSAASEESDSYRPTTSSRSQRTAAPRKSTRRAPKKTVTRPSARSVRTKRLSETTSSSSSSSSSSSDDSSSEESDERPSRISNRNPVAKKVSYKENSETATESDDLIEYDANSSGPAAKNENAETIEKVLKRRIGRVGASGSKTAMYNVEENGDPNEAVIPDGEELQKETQYLIKWKHWAHIHNTWESEATLKEQKVNGLKKLDNFTKREEELQEWRDAVTAEDIEYFDCQQEMMQELLQSYCNVERVITHKANNNSSYPDYFVKWQGLPYADCTWEDGELIVHRFSSCIEEYNLRNKSQKIPTKLCKALKSRTKFAPLKKQPHFIGGENKELILRDYQMEGLNWLLHSWCRHNSVILADEMGLGKTIQMISLLTALMNFHHVYGPFLLVVPLSTIVTWQREFKTWAPEVNVIVYMGDITSRNIIRDFEWCHTGNKRLKFNVVVTTYEILLKDKSFLSSIAWAVLGVDEAHRLKNDDSLLYKSLYTFNTYHRVLITGTPLQNSLKELWSLLHFIMPEKFGEWAEFESRHSSADKTGFAQLHKELEPYLLRRVKKDVEKSLPAKTEQILRVEMSKRQRQFYRWILTKNYKALSKGVKGSMSGFLNVIMELKKCCNHANLIRLPDDDEKGAFELETLIKGSGKLILLDKLLLRLRDSGHRVLIFSQMVRMLNILADYMQFRRFPYQRLDGSIRGELRKQAMDHFNAEGSQDFCFLLSTRAGGLGVNLATADTVIIFDSDWNPQNDLQAQARAHRIGQKKQVSVYRLVTKGSIEEDIVERAKKKMVLDHLVIQRMDTTGRTVLNRGSIGGGQGGGNPFNKDELNDILKFGAEELFKDDGDEDQEVNVDIDDILNRAETRCTEEEQSGVTDELLSQFKVVSFDNLEDEEIERNKKGSGGGLQKAWEDIIPEEDRKKMEEEEIQQQLMELNLPPRSRKQIKNLQFDSDDEYQQKERSKKAGQEDDSFTSDEDSDEDHSKRKGRPRASNKDNIKGFTDAEVRRFIKSFKKFGQPLERLDSIAGDAELQEKSSSDLQRLAEMVHNQCHQAMQEYEEKLKEDPTSEVGKRSRGPTFKISRVSVNAKSVVQATMELEALTAVMPSDKEERKRYTIEFHVKSTHFDCPWESLDDAHLLWGVYEYGMGNWEAIKMDPDFDLHDKILPDGDLKPQTKHLQTRTEYLLKTLAKHLGKSVEQTSEKKPKKEKKRQAAISASKKSKNVSKNPKIKSKEIIDDADTEDDSDDNRTHQHGAEKDTKNDDKNSAPSSPKKRKKKKEKDAEKKEDDDEEEEEGEVKDKKKKKKKKKKKEVSGPVHITMKATKLITGSGEMPEELPQEIFAQCKDRMRPVKKALKALDNPDPSLSGSDQVAHTRRCLLKIGDHIHHCLDGFKDPEVSKEWRTFFWMFVSKFTEFDAVKLHKLYKYAVKKREDSKKEKSESSSQPHSQNHPPTHKRLHGDQHPPSHQQGDKSKDPHRPQKRMHPPPENWSDNSREEAGGRYHGNSNQMNTGYNSNYRQHGGDWEPTQDNNSLERWQIASPLSRSEDKPRNRFGDSFSNYNRPPNAYSGDKRSHQGDKPFRGNKARFNSDRRDPGGMHFSRDPRDHSSSYSNTQHFNRFDPRQQQHGGYRGNDYNRGPEHDYFGHRQMDDRDDRFSYNDRKRKPMDRDRPAVPSDRRPPKEPKLYGSPVEEQIGAKIPTLMSSSMTSPGQDPPQQRYMPH